MPEPRSPLLTRETHVAALLSAPNGSAVIRSATAQVHQVIRSVLSRCGEDGDPLLGEHLNPVTWKQSFSALTRLSDQWFSLGGEADVAQHTQAQQHVAVRSARLLEAVFTPDRACRLQPAPATTASDTGRMLAWCLEEGRRQSTQDDTEAAAARSARRLGLDVTTYARYRSDLRHVSVLRRRAAASLAPLMGPTEDFTSVDLHLIASLLQQATTFPAVIAVRRAYQRRTSKPLPKKLGLPDQAHLTELAPHLPTGPLSLLLAARDAQDAAFVLTTLAGRLCSTPWAPDPEAVQAEDAADPALIGLWSALTTTARTQQNHPAWGRSVRPGSP